METGQVLEGLKDFRRDMDWIYENQDQLRKKHPDKYVAVMNQKVIDFDSDLKTLIYRLKEKGKNPSEIPIEYISQEPIRLIL